MPEGANTRGPESPVDLWEQWYDTAARVWARTLDGNKESFVDPFGLYRAWLKGVGEAQEQVKAGFAGTMDPKEAWKQWFEATTDAWKTVAEKGADPLGLTTQWLEMMEEARAKMVSGEITPADPFTFFKQWYDATSETWAKVIGDVIGTDQFMEAASQFLASYTSFYRTLRRSSEEYFHNLQLPTRSDIARVAELVIALEDKVDRIDDVFSDFEEGYSRVASSEAVGNLERRLDQVESRLVPFSTALQQLAGVESLEKRLDRVESKLDKLLSMLEKGGAKEAPRTSRSPNSARGRTRGTRRSSARGQAEPLEVQPS